MTTIRPIRLLDENTANQIAAGEVVERPASVVKELVENAIDAGCTAVSVDIAGGGIGQIRVTDNGSGIAPGDVRLAFERHATSKISAAQDLKSIATLGFRGEALPSIASVSKMTLTTKTAQDDAGVKISVEAGRILDIRQAGAPQGTSVVVSDLFFNTPARRKFLKKPSAEAAAVGELLTALALANPHLSIRFSIEGKTVFQTPGDGQLLSALHTVFGSAAAKNMIPVQGQSGYVKASGYVGVGEASRGTRQNELLCLNGRTVKSLPLYQAVETALKERVMIGRFPICALSISVPLESVDVNCHPAKTEVRFADEGYVRQALYDILVQSLQAYSSQAALDQALSCTPPEANMLPLPENKKAAEPMSFGVAPFASLRLHDNAAPFAASTPVPTEPAMPKPSAAAIAAPPLPPSPLEQQTHEALADAPKEGQVPAYEIMGQAFSTYVFIKTASAVLVLDQHAAHERILYDRYKAVLGTDDLSQQLLVPHIFDVTLRDKQVILDNLPALEQAGFCVEDFGPASVRVSAVPVILGEPSLASFFAEFVDKLALFGSLGTPQRQVEQIMYLACRKAVKAGDPLSREEIEALLIALSSSSSAPTCPHGRPLFVEITKKELEKRFRRVP